MVDGVNTSLEHLKICMSVYEQKKQHGIQYISNNLLSFVHVFKNLRHFSLFNTPVTNDGFFSSILANMPLVSLKVKQCMLSTGVDIDLF